MAWCEVHRCPIEACAGWTHSVVPTRKLPPDPTQRRSTPIAEGRMKEFDPAAERHHFGFVVKAIEPRCTTEVQIEEADGRVSRLTTTEEPSTDVAAIREAVSAALDRFLAHWVR